MSKQRSSSPKPSPSPSAVPTRRSRSPRAALILAGAGLVLLLLLLAVARGPGTPSGEPQASNPSPGTPEATGTTGSPNAPVNLDDLPEGHPPVSSSTGNKPGSPAPKPDTAPGTPPVSGAMKPNDLPSDHPTLSTAGDEKQQASIQWLGYSCFYVYYGGSTVVMDPFKPSATGFPKPDTGAHLVTVSTDSPAHNETDAVRSFPGEQKEIVRGKEAVHGPIKVTPVATTGEEGRPNTAYLIQAGDLRIAHLGALGGPLTPAQLKALGKVDIAMVPVGIQPDAGLTANAAVEAAVRLGARIILPMGYTRAETEGAPELSRLERFIAASPFAVTPKEQNIFMVGKSDLPASPEIYRLRFQR